MSTKFLRLSCGLILNPKYIQTIQINPNFISIVVTDFSIQGWHFLSLGIINSTNSYRLMYEKDTQLVDYNNIMKWIDDNTK